MSTPKVSIIIPVYNAQSTLSQCLESALNQNYESYEVIVVDNNSTDKTKRIIYEFESKDKKIKYAFEGYRSRGAARNTGEKMAQGEIVLMTDSDCILPKNWVCEIIKPVLEEGYDAVQGSAEPANDNFWSRQIQRRLPIEKTYRGEILGKIDTKNFAISMASLRYIGLTPRRYPSGNDTALSIKIERNNLKVKFLYDVMVKHFYTDTFKKIMKKYCYRAFWTAVITKNNDDRLKNTAFIKDTNQAVSTFFGFFPSLPYALMSKGLKWAYFELITGIAWRIGLLGGWLFGKRTIRDSFLI